MEWQKQVFLIAVAVVLYRVIPLYIQHFGVYEDIYNHYPGKCTYVQGINHGAEDIHLFPDGRCFISSGLEKMFNKTTSVKGLIYLYNLNEVEKAPVPIKVEGLHTDFTPHGLSLYYNETSGNTVMFVINHLDSEDHIEKFLYDEKTNTLKHANSFHDTRLTHASDVAAIGENELYFTNYGYFANPTLRLVELISPMTWGSVYLWRLGERPQLVVNDLKQPNGIATSPSGRLVYVLNEGEQELLILKREANDSLTLVQNFNLNTSADNVHASADGENLWIGSHSAFWKVTKHTTDRSYKAPSQVIRVQLKGGSRVTRVTEVFADDGGILKGSSAAVYYQGKLLIGTVIHKLLLCSMDDRY